MPIYSDFIDRIFLQDDLLHRLIPGETYSTTLVLRIREADDSAIAGEKTVSQPGNFGLVRGGLLYAVDAIHEAHNFFQDAKSDLGSYWHGMMHRREGDFDNARYWFRRAGTLPCFAGLHRAASQYSADMAKQPSWDPYLFTGLCEQARFGEEEIVAELLKLQRTEFDTIFNYTWRQSVS
jgi:hypothetical protein